MRFLKKTGIFLLSFAAGLFLVFFSYARTDFFEERKIYGEGLFENLRNSVDPSLDGQEEMPALFSQPFFYLGHGKQCYAFESEDRQYVIKFFNFSANQRPSFLGSLKLPFLEKILARKERRGKAFFQGYCLDLCIKDLFPEMTATLQVGFGKGSSGQELILYDKWRQKHCIHLEKTAFVLQKKVSPFLPWLKEALFQEDLFRARMGAYLDLLFSRLEMGIVDPDGRLLDHIGLVEGSLFFVDQGRIFLEEKLESPPFLKEKMTKETYEMRKFLIGECPDKLQVLEEGVQKRLSSRNEKSVGDKRSLLHRLFDQRTRKSH